MRYFKVDMTLGDFFTKINYSKKITAADAYPLSAYGMPVNETMDAIILNSVTEIKKSCL